MTTRAPMQEDAWRLAARLPGAKDLHGEAEGTGARAITRLLHDEPAAFPSDLAGPIALDQAVATLESWKGGLSRQVRCEGHDQQHDGDQTCDGGQRTRDRAGCHSHSSGTSTIRS